MTADELKNRISECICDITWSVNDYNCGVTEEVDDFIPTFQVWCGNNWKEYVNDIEALMADPYYNGHSLNEIAETLDFIEH